MLFKLLLWIGIMNVNRGYIESIAERAARDEVTRIHDREWFVRQLDAWNLWNEVNSRCDKRVIRMLPTVFNERMSEYLRSEFDSVLTRKMNVLFPQFAANDPQIRLHLSNHITDISNLMDRKKEGITSEIESVGKRTADNMAQDDKFGSIYKSITEEANKKITSEGFKVKSDIVKQMDEELKKTREERDKVIASLQKTQQDLSKSLSDQNKFKWLATGGFATGIMGLVGVAVLANNK